MLPFYGMSKLNGSMKCIYPILSRFCAARVLYRRPLQEFPDTFPTSGSDEVDLCTQHVHLENALIAVDLFWLSTGQSKRWAGPNTVTLESNVFELISILTIVVTPLK
jgi:hypothetical protein